MSQVSDEGLHWANDGHIVNFRWVRDEVKIDWVHCPHEGTNSFCNRRRDYCVVRRFLEFYGPELNMGEVDINGPIEVAWAAQLGETDLDPEYGGIWVIPVEDPVFRAMTRAIEES